MLNPNGKVEFVTNNTIPEKRTGDYLYVVELEDGTVSALGLSYQDSMRAMRAKVEYFPKEKAAPYIANLTPTFTCRECFGHCGMTKEGAERHKEVTDHEYQQEA